ncbi:redoxin family protein [Rubinisphaera brasiliensis]|uniref:Redoxin domain protein n=1 Tax=Rubinisphaera brasiliensis (strain ATCC 49424 / DSM 5305 / JCM 21570 / IAM 15109 / NBRC 103401 / IFAM 1448) TaxID=756272 RepID=F0SS33_RUBBR|nr:redoxin family protein [Rubinisphaera brasiliensis]ADY61371.1 Redoxin domain protein [Rubinisphaera brasiliensis DSM 5305]
MTTRRIINLTIAVVVCAVPLVGHVWAQNTLEKRFDQLDRNQDGKITPNELPAAEFFKRLDLDGNSEITKPEAARALARGALNDVTQSANENLAPSSPTPTESPVREGPRPIKPGEHGVGKQIPDLSFTDIAGKQYNLSDFRDQKAVIFAMTGTGCPLCLKYAPSLAAIEKQYRDKGVTFVFINPNESEKSERLREAVETHGFQGPYVSDGQKKLPAVLGAETTTEVFVLDQARTLVYRGAVDDQYGFAYALDEPRVTYLTDALDAVLAGHTPEVQATSSPGCELFYDKTAKPETPTSITYHNRISRIIQANCIECHREGGIAPIALETYDEVKDYAGMIRNVVERGVMPPWFAAPQASEGNEKSLALHWTNDRSLSASEKEDLFAWIKAGALEGNSADAPLPKTFPGGWLIGKPDAVFEFPQPVPVKATGTMPYRNVTVETDLPEDKWVQAIEVRPGKVDVVHHVIVSLRAGEGEIDERDGYWGVYVPGNSTLVYPDGYAKLLPKGAKLRFQMHYTPNGTATEDSTRIGVIFAKEPPRHEVKVAGIANARISIPPRADNHQEVASLRLPYDIQVLGFLPHMHLRGKAARYEALTADGTEMLLDIPRYDFNWQLLYRLAEPQSFKAGDTIRFTCWFDNSENNPANPDPAKTVRWGPQTEDEMHLGYVEYIVPGAKPGEPVGGMRRVRAAGAVRNAVGSGLFNRLDTNGDGFVTRDEVRQKLPDNPNASGPIFDRLDRDRNGKLDKTEFSRLPQ